MMALDVKSSKLKLLKIHPDEKMNVANFMAIHPICTFH